MDFLVVWASQVPSPLEGSLVVTSRRTLAASFLAELSVLTRWWGQMSQGSACFVRLNPFEFPASAAALLFLQVVLWSVVPLVGQGLLVPSLEPVSGDPVLGVLNIAVLHNTWLSHQHTPQQKELRAASPGWWIEVVQRTCHSVSSLHAACFTPQLFLCDASFYLVWAMYTYWSVSPS